jgi:hypothetical protein
MTISSMILSPLAAPSGHAQPAAINENRVNRVAVALDEASPTPQRYHGACLGDMSHLVAHTRTESRSARAMRRTAPTLS